MKKTACLLLANIFTIFLSAQSVSTPKNIQSPNAGSLGQYGDVPVTLYHGTANISIPIYSISEGGIPLEISLNYDASGVRVNSVPGWLGQNWSLNAGGVITRTVQGKRADELNFSEWINFLNTPGYMYNSSKLNRTDWAAPNVLKDFSTQVAYTLDLEPDIFTFNFMGHSGKFFLSQDGTWKVQSSSNLKVIIQESDFVRPLDLTKMGCGPNQNLPYSKVIGKITLIDDNGTSYIFGGFQNAIEYSYDNFFNQCETTNLISNSWSLVEVKNNLGLSVFKFEYERGDYIGSFYLNENSVVGLKDGGHSLNILDQLDTRCMGTISNNSGVGGSLIVPSYLKKITSLTGQEIVFESIKSDHLKYPTSVIDMNNFNNDYNSQLFNSSFGKLVLDQNGQQVNFGGLLKQDFVMSRLIWRKLKSIKLPTQLVSFVFNDNDVNQRLKLNNVKIGDKDYAFEYDRFDQLPQFISKAIDHWGYFNGTPYVTNPLNIDTYYSTRNTNADKAKIGSLTKITFPTKGWTNFEYESNTYSKFVNEKRELVPEIGLAGGLRIKSITKNDGEGKTYTKQYKYTTDLTSSVSTGILMLKNKYSHPEWKTKASDNYFYYQSSFSTNNLIPMSNTLGYHIGYSRVYEILEDGSYSMNDYTDYNEFKDIRFVSTLSESHSIFDKHNDLSMLRGKLKQQTIYNNNGEVKLRKTYSFIADLTKKVRAFNFDILFPCPYSNVIASSGNAYEIYYFDFNVAKEVEESFLSGQVLDKEISYTWYDWSDSDTFLRSKTSQTYLAAEQLDSKSIKEEYVYPFDNQSVSYPNGIMTEKRMLSPIITTQVENTQLLSTQALVYNSDDNYVNRIFPEKTQIAFGTAILRDDIIFDKYDVNGNLQQYHKKDGMYTTIIYGYNKRYPIVKIESKDKLDFSNATFANLNSSLSNLPGIKAEAEVITTLNSIRAAYPDYMITTYTHKTDVGVTSLTNPRGITEYYQYDLNNRLQRIVDFEGNTVKEYEYQFKN